MHADTPPVERPPAAKPVEKLPLPRVQLTLEGEVTPELAPIAGRLVALFYQSYPKLLERFEHPSRPAPREIRIVFVPKLDHPAHCVGHTITISADWMLQHPDDLGLLTHELTHAVQNYPQSDPGWLTEGIADYARHLYGPEQQPGWKLPERLTEKQSYRNSYGVTARFLVWVEDKHPGAVDKMHRQMQDREFRVENFEELTGKSVDTLWAECVKELNTAR